MTRAEWLAIVERDRSWQPDQQIQPRWPMAVEDRHLLIEAVRELVEHLRPFGSNSEDEFISWDIVSVREAIAPFEEEK